MMTKEEAKSICVQAVEEFGREAQANVAIEEMAELTVALEHFRRGRATMDDVRTEIADVFVMMLQLSYIFGEDDVSEEMNRKLERLKGRIRGYVPPIAKEYYGG